MSNWRTMVGALCVILAMVLGAFAGFVYANDAGGVGASPTAGTRGEDRRLLSAFDESQKLRNSEEAEDFAVQVDGVPQSILGSEDIELLSPDGATAKPVTMEETRWAAEQTATHVYESEDGTITVTPSQGTRGHLAPGAVDAGGPYGGANTFEGTVLTFTVTTTDPSIIFYRWDLNNDGVFDSPAQDASCGTLGCWTTETTLTVPYLDNYFGDIIVEGWDGISTTIVLNSGDTLAQQTSFQWFIGFGGWNFAWQFRAKKDMQVTALGHYHYVYNLFDQALWSDSGVRLGSCTPVHVSFQWNWCSLPSPVNLVLGNTYRISIRIQTWTTAINSPSDNDVVQYQGTYYCFSPSVLCFPSTFWTSTFIPLIDFRWTETLIRPDAGRDGAFLEINNVAPTVFNADTSPSPGQEGLPTNFVADFTDPGLDDTWEYRWIFHDGEVSPWRSVSKYSGGARVLILHSWTGDVGPFKGQIVAACGNFCITVDDLDFGPLGQNRIPSLDELTAYDVLLIGTNWGPIPNPNAVGDRLAEYMDAGGDIVMMFAGYASSNLWGIGGRWQSEAYSPIGRSGFAFFNANLGTIYVPGHPVLDGVSSFASFYRHNVFGVSAGATRVADFTDGRVAIAEKFQPNGACALALPWFPRNSGGDYWRVIVNSLRYCSGNADPVLKTMPITLDSLAKVFRDDDPTTTTPQDSFPVRVEVRDDDHGKLKVVSEDPLFFNNFENPSECSWSFFSQRWPAGWSSSPPQGWRCQFDSQGGSRGPVTWYFYNDPNYGSGDGHSFLNTGLYDLSGYAGVRFEFYTYWQADYPFGTSDGFVEASLDGGATYPVELVSYHHNDPASLRGNVELQNTDVGGEPNVRFRFRYESNDDWWWFVDNVRITGIVGEVMDGLGSADGVATIANVPPTVIGGFDSALRNEAQSLLFKGFEITDPALLEPTEWYAYSWNFDDGTAVDWRYVGTLAPPRMSVLIVHTLCLSGSGCGDYTSLRDTLLGSDVVASVDGFNFINFPLLPTAPTLSLLLQYDVVLVVTNWAYISFQPFDLARRQVGDRIAQYIDAGRGGVLSFMAIYDLSSFFGDIFTINGRYMDDDYGPFEKETYTFTPGQGINILDPDHEIFTKVSGNVNSLFISPGDMKLTVGGNNNAAGRNGVLLARWKNTNNPSVGIKELNNGMRTAHFGAFGHPDGADTPMLIRNMIGWVAGGIPSPKIPAFTHTYGDNGIYTVDLRVIDDDMGFVFDTTANRPVEALPGASVAHRFMRVAVDNVDPTIVPNSIEAFIAAQVCIRISGSGGNSVTANFFTDGTLSASTTVTRVGGSPNPTDEKCGLLKVDVTAPHAFDATLTYSAPMGGSNPTWLVIAPWREPVSPGHGTVTYKYDFDASGATVDQDLSTLKGDLIAGGQGAKIDFVAEAYDDGTDDLAFLWSWGTVFGSPYEVPNPSDAVYTIHVHHNGGMARTDGMLNGPQFLGFSEAYFDRAMNTGRSPAGTMGFAVRDSAVHAFDGTQMVYYVTLIVADDDNTRGYPSEFAPNDGVDMQFVVIDLR